MGVNSTSARPEPWDVVIDRSDELLDELLECGFSAELGERIEILVRQLCAAGRITSPFEHRRRLTTSMRFWASTLSIERSHRYPAPVLAEAASGFTLPQMEASEARRLIRGGKVIADHTIMGYADGPKALEDPATTRTPPSLHDYKVSNCCLAGGGIKDLRIPGELDLHGTTMIEFGITDLDLRKLAASSTRIIGAGLRELAVRGEANFAWTVMRSLVIENCIFRDVVFNNAELGVPAETDRDGLRTFDNLRAALAPFGFDTGEPITLRNVTVETADFDTAVLDGVTFDRCSLKGVDFSVARSVHGMRFINGCKLDGATLMGAPGDRQIYVDESSAAGVDHLPPASTSA